MSIISPPYRHTHTHTHLNPQVHKTIINTPLSARTHRYALTFMCTQTLPPTTTPTPPPDTHKHTPRFSHKYAHKHHLPASHPPVQPPHPPTYTHTREHTNSQSGPCRVNIEQRRCGTVTCRGTRTLCLLVPQGPVLSGKPCSIHGLSHWDRRGRMVVTANTVEARCKQLSGGTVTVTQYAHRYAVCI